MNCSGLEKKHRIILCQMLQAFMKSKFAFREPIHIPDATFKLEVAGSFLLSYCRPMSSGSLSVARRVAWRRWRQVVPIFPGTIALADHEDGSTEEGRETLLLESLEAVGLGSPLSAVLGTMDPRRHHVWLYSPWHASPCHA